MPPTRELHIVRAYHLHYMSLLNHYTKHVTFIKNTPNPALDGLSEEDRICSAKLLHRECDNLINETERLSSELSMQERRLKNVLNLVSYTYRLCQSFLNQCDRCLRKPLFEIILVSYNLEILDDMRTHATFSAVCY